MYYLVTSFDKVVYKGSNYTQAFIAKQFQGEPSQIRFFQDKSLAEYFALFCLK